MTLPIFESVAAISPDGLFRYSLSRRWNLDRATLAWCMLNPSKADGVINDPTITRCCNFAADWGYGGLVVVNLFGLRATDPRTLQHAPDPFGPGNLSALHELTAGLAVIAAWGATVEHLPRWSGYVAETAMWLRAERVTYTLGFTASGHPRHPLYLSRDTRPQPWEPAGERLL